VTKARHSGYRIELDETGQSTPNFCLLEKLKQSMDVTIPGLANPEADESGIDLDAAFRAVRVAMAEKGLPFRVEATADLAILQFAKFRLWKDLDENWAEFTKNGLVQHLVETPTEAFQDSYDISPDTADLDSLAAQCPIPADSSQLTAIADAVAGRSFVLEGPPGTGKSQTITNLLARAMAEGKRVLFVAEKRAALDVVKSRLDAVGMGPFSLDLHDKGSKPVAVREQLKLAIDHRVEVDRQGLQARTEETASTVRRLTRYAQRLHEDNGAGLSLYSATTQLLTVRDDVRPLPVPPSLLVAQSSAAIEAIRQMLRALPEVADAARPQRHHPWGFVAVESLSPESRSVVQGSLGVAKQSLATLRSHQELGPVLARVGSVGDLRTLAGILAHPELSIETLDETRTERWRAAAAATRQEIHAFVAAAHPGLDQATPRVLELPLADIHAQAKGAQESSWFGRKKRLLAVLAQLEPGLRDAHTVAPKRLTELTGALVQLQGAVVHLADHTTAVPGLRVPPGWNPLTEEGAAVVKQQIEWLEWAGEAVQGSASSASSLGEELRKMLLGGIRVEPDLVSVVCDLATALESIFAKTGATDVSVTDWAAELPLLTRWEGTSAGRSAVDPQLPSLSRWLELRRALSPLATHGMEHARTMLLRRDVEADDAVDAFERGLAEASVDERRTSTGLDTFDAPNHERSIERFRASLGCVQEMLRDALPDEVVAGRSFSAGSEVGRIGALRRELAKTRRGLGVRALMETYGDLVTQLTPCVLVSPDSLARFFPAAAGQFDLLVFDEASQIRVADAVGAMGRATAVVVVGDSRQMPPTSVAESSIEVDSDDGVVELVVEDEESILTECVLARIPQHWLSWHYRSQDESL
ncbi:MAG: AAA domain-containing protein, partial [Nocardioidaceae bacterium]